MKKFLEAKEFHTTRSVFSYHHAKDVQFSRLNKSSDTLCYAIKTKEERQTLWSLPVLHYSLI